MVQEEDHLHLPGQPILGSGTEEEETNDIDDNFRVNFNKSYPVDTALAFAIASFSRVILCVAIRYMAKMLSRGKTSASHCQYHVRRKPI